MEDQVEVIEPIGKEVVELIDVVETEINPPIEEKFYYTILAPKSFRPNSDFGFNLTIHEAAECEFDEPIVVRVSIQDEDNDDGFETHQDVTMKPNTTELVKIPIGDISLNNNYKLVVKGVSGITMEREASLDLQTQKHSILIQTDKAIYKPKDCIRFRVLVLNSELKAATISNHELNIQIADSCRNLMKNWNGVNTVNGVFSGEYQLSDIPNLGEWKLTAAIGDQMKIAVIEIAEYVLPKFEAQIESDDHFTIDDQKVVAIIRAKYTHGKPLRGTAVVSISEEDNFGYFRYRRCLPNKKPDDDDTCVKKTIIIDGQESVEFDIQNDLKFDRSECNKYCDLKNFKIKAEVTETLTGLSQCAEKTIKVHKDTYDISTDLSNDAIKRDSTINLNISVRKQNGSSINSVDPVKKTITLVREQFYADVDESTVSETTHDLDENGKCFLSLDVAKNESSFSLKAKYVKQETDLGMFYTTPNKVADKICLNAKVLTQKCSINEEIEIEVMSHYAFSTYTYVIVGRGRILETKTVSPVFEDSDATEYTHRFSFHPNFDYAPKAKVIVYCVRNQSIVTADVCVDLHDDFKNFIDMDVTPNTTNPGHTVDINVKSNPNSYIGLLGIDKSVLILRGGNDLAHDQIWNELESFNTQVKYRSYDYSEERKRPLPSYYNPWDDFSRADLITFSNATEPIRVICYKMMACDTMARGSCFSDPEGMIKPTIRKDFPETWIWESIADKSFNGTLNLRKKVPDALTTWVLTAFSIDPINGLAIMKKPCEVIVQQQFHISLNLPYSVKRGEIVTVPCSVFNYLPNDIDADIILENEHNEFEFVDSAVSDQIYPEIMKQQFRKKKLTIRSQDALNALFTIRPIKVGLISLKVSAVSTTVSDCIIKTLNVECEGVPQFVNKAVYIDLREKSQIDPLDLQIEIPKIALPDSTRIEITCVGDLLGGTIKNLQNLIRLPYGCGEQNMLNFVPNIVVLNYLKNTHQLAAEIEAKAKKFMEIGYQRELTYKHKDGSFSAFGQSDKSGSTWLTAFVARSFRQAAEHITVQDDIINESLKWLSGTQADDGSFIEKGSICHKEMQSGSSNGVALTAYVLIAFLINKNSNNEYEATIQKAIQNVLKSIENCSDVYALAVSAYALQLADHESKNMILTRLAELAKTKDNQKWWDKSIELDGCCYKESKTLNVETTAYALLTLQSVGNDSECLSILKWLLNQRNDQGGFEGTQDTIVGIEALASFATKISTKNNKININISTSNDTKFDFMVNAENALVLQSQQLAPDVQSIHINASGEGFALMELSSRYHIDTPEAKAAFSLEPSVKLVNAEHMSLEIDTAYQPPKTNDNVVNRSNMVVMEIAMPSGFVVNSELLNGLKSTQTLIKRIETKDSDTVAIIYFDHLTLVPIKLQIDGFREHLVEEQKPASIRIYDYYDNALSARKFYSLPAADLETTT